MSRTALDSSVIIAALLGWHEAHSRASAALQALLAEPESPLLPVHSLLEAYSVMTRLPAPRRVSPRQAWTMLHQSLRETTRLVGAPSEATWSFLEGLAARSVSGGTTYDAWILATARKARAGRLLTLNPRHFERLAEGEVEILEP